jgi:hypothetical protein
MFENLGMRAGLIIAAVLCLCGLPTLFWMFTYGVLRRGRRSRLRTVFVVFGTLGLLIPAGIGAVSLTNRVVPDSILSAWPTSFLLAAGEYGDPLWYVILPFGAAIVGNVGLYGFAGLLVGGAWNWIRSKYPDTEGGQSWPSP